MSKVHEQSVVGIAYRLSTNSGDLIEETGKQEPFSFLMGVEAVVPGLEKALMGRSAGETFSVCLEPAEAYGVRDEALIGEVSRSQFGFEDTLVRGMRFQAQVGNSMRLLTIVGIEGDTVRVDANHELAGQTLNFDIEVVSVRDATEEELSHRHVHEDGTCGHDHQHGHCCGGHGHGGESDHEGCCGGHGHEHEDHEHGQCCGGQGHEAGEDDCCCRKEQ